MNERFRLNTTLILEFLAKRGLKKGFVAKAAGVSGTTFHRMLSKSHIPADRGVTERLAALMGVDERQLILPRESESQTA